MTGAGFAQALVLGGLAQASATQKVQHQFACQAGLDISLQGFDQRFSSKAVDFMRQLLDVGLKQVVQSEAETTLLPQFNGVYLTDCSRLVWSGSGLKLALRWELQRGRLQAEVLELQQHDQCAPLLENELPRGALQLGDLGFFNLKRFQRWHDQGVLWLTRYKVGTLVHTLDGQRLSLTEVLQHATSPLTLSVRLGAHQAVSAYLLAAPLPDDAYAQRCARLKEQARLDQRPLSAHQLALARWTIYLTNCPDLSFAQAHVLARTRWQIELLFKLWKSHAKLLVSRSANPIRQQVEGYAKLLGVLVAHWLLLVHGWQSHLVSMVDAFACLRTHIPLLLYAFRFPFLWQLFTEVLRSTLATAPRFSPRRKHPLAFQFWRDFAAYAP